MNRVWWDLEGENSTPVRMRTTPMYAEWMDLGPDRVRVINNGMSVLQPPGTYTVVLDPSTFPDGLRLTVDPDGNNDGRFIVTIGPGEDSRAAVFGLAPPRLPRTGSDLGMLLRSAGLLLAAGLILMMLRRRKDGTTQSPRPSPPIVS